MSDLCSDLIFSVPKIVSFLSRSTTLLPGTLILTGTPAGVGVGCSPKEFLHEGDEFAVEILPHIGTLITQFENVSYHCWTLKALHYIRCKTYTPMLQVKPPKGPFKLVTVNTAPERAKRLVGRVADILSDRFTIEHVDNCDCMCH